MTFYKCPLKFKIIRLRTIKKNNSDLPILRTTKNGCKGERLLLKKITNTF